MPQLFTVPVDSTVDELSIVDVHYILKSYLRERLLSFVAWQFTGSRCDLASPAKAPITKPKTTVNFHRVPTFWLALDFTAIFAWYAWNHLHFRFPARTVAYMLDAVNKKVIPQTVFQKASSLQEARLSQRPRVALYRRRPKSWQLLQNCNIWKMWN